MISCNILLNHRELLNVYYRDKNSISGRGKLFSFGDIMVNVVVFVCEADSTVRENNVPCIMIAMRKQYIVQNINY